MSVKTSAKKAKKDEPLKETVKVTWDDIQVGFERLQKLHEETEESFKKFQDETRKAIKETQKNVGGLNNSLGSIVERLLIPGLPQK
jgi:predicted HicB family RNase H-like nuclease